MGSAFAAISGCGSRPSGLLSAQLLLDLADKWGLRPVTERFDQ